MKLTLLTICLLLTLFTCSSLGRLRAVQHYQQKATEDCLNKHTPEECRALNYPACDSTGRECHQ